MYSSDAYTKFSVYVGVVSWEFTINPSNILSNSFKLLVLGYLLKVLSVFGIAVMMVLLDSVNCSKVNYDKGI